VGLSGARKQASVKHYIMRSFTISTPKKCCSSDQIENNEMGGACTTYEGEKRFI
jgi:hypothetical protein